MTSVIIREQKRYSRETLQALFNKDELSIVSIIKKLKELNIIKTVKNNSRQIDLIDLVDDDIEIVDEEDYSSDRLYVFTFVGIILVDDLVLKCFPKYIDVDSESAEYLENTLRQVIMVLQKYDNSREQIINVFSHDDSNSFNLLAAMVYLLEDYSKNGLYINEHYTIDTNGEGEIDWNRTINQINPYIQDNLPFYVELKTRRRMINNYDFFKRLHEIVLTYSSHKIEDAGLDNILGISGVDLSEDTIDELGEEDYILYKIKKEKQIQFNTRKQELLSILEAFITHKATKHNLESFSLYGTTSFNLVWEDVCAKVLNSQLKTKIRLLELPNDISDKYNAEDRLIDLIEKPKWTNESLDVSFETDTLKPDLISLGNSQGVSYFTVFDAKYYNTKINKNGVTSNPGVESIVKQYAYLMTYKQFIIDSGIEEVNNCFVMPMDSKEDELVRDEGCVSLNIYGNQDPIKVRKIRADVFYQYYLKSQTVNIEEMEL